MTISFGTGQTSGLPLVVTAITQAGAQTLHTAPVGTAVPNRVRIAAVNLTNLEQIVHVGIVNSSAVLIAQWKIAVPANCGWGNVLAPIEAPLLAVPELVLNGTAVIQVWADVASAVAVQARVDDQGGIAAITAGSGQTSGLPLVVSAITQGTAQTLHTDPAGAATPNLVRISALNLDPANPHILHVGIVNSGAVLIAQYQLALPINEGFFPGVDQSNSIELILDGTAVIQVWTDTASQIAVMANVNTQIGGGGSGGAGSTPLVSGLIAAVQNTNEFRANGIAAGSTESIQQIIMPRAGTISNLVAKASAAVGGGATVTVAVRVNGVSTALSLTLANADGTALKTSLGSVAVAQGDLVTFLVGTDNAGAPAANIQAAALFT